MKPSQSSLEVISTISPISPAIEAGFEAWHWADSVTKPQDKTGDSDLGYLASNTVRDTIAIHIADQLPDQTWTKAVSNYLNNFMRTIHKDPQMLSDFNEVLLYMAAFPDNTAENFPEDLAERLGPLLGKFIDFAEYIIEDSMPVFKQEGVN